MKIRGTDYFFYNVTNLKRSIAFYHGLLGLKIIAQTGQWAEFETGNMTLAVGMYGATDDGGKEKNSAAAALALDDVKGAVKFLKSKKVRISTDAMDFDPCEMATVLDPDGNQIILHHRKDGTVG